jgi:rhodanese-related sulfurtransferase
MKISRFNRSLPLLALVAGSLSLQVQAAEQAAARPAEKPVVTKFDRAQLDEWLAKPSKVVVIDLRRPDEHQSIGALPVFLSIQNADLEKYLDYIPRDRAVITVSNHASRANKAAAVLLKHGFNVVGEVGVEDYEAQPPPPKVAASPAAQ